MKYLDVRHDMSPNGARPIKCCERRPLAVFGMLCMVTLYSTVITCFCSPGDEISAVIPSWCLFSSEGSCTPMVIPSSLLILLQR